MGAFDMTFKDVNNAVIGDKKKPDPIAPAAVVPTTGIAAPSFSQPSVLAAPKAIIDPVAPVVQPSAVQGAPIPAMETPPGIAKNMATNPAPQPAPATIADIPKPVGQAQVMRNQPASTVAAASVPTDPNPGAAPMVIDGVKYGPAPTKTLNPFSAMAQGYAGTIAAVTPSFDGRSDTRLAANRAELNNGTSANPTQPSAANPTVKPGQAQTAAGVGTSGVQATANNNESTLAGRQGAYMAENNLRSFEDKGNGIARQVGADGKTTFTNVGTGGVTDASKSVQVNSYDGKALNESLARAVQAKNGPEAQGGIAYIPPSNDGPSQIDLDNAERTRQGAIRDMMDNMKRAGTRTERAAFGQALQTMLAGQGQLAVESLRGANNQASEQGRNAVQMRGQDMAAKTHAAQLAGNPLDNQAKQNQVEAGKMTNASTKRLQDLQTAYGAEQDPAKQRAMAEQIRVLSGKGGTDRFIAVQGGEEFGPDGVTKIRRPSSIFDSSTREYVQQGQGAQQKGQQQAPASAIEYLKKNPAQSAAFKAKYGYLPEGV